MIGDQLFQFLCRSFASVQTILLLCVFLQACAYVDAGYSVIPLKLNGKKEPALASWKEYQTRFPLAKELWDWFETPKGIGIVTGSISGGLEVIDFDMGVLKDPALSMLPDSLVAKLAIYQTPGGWHVMYKCDEICGSKKIAMWEPPNGKGQRENGHRDGTGGQSVGRGVRVESKGEAAYVVAAGSPLHVHPTRRPYRHHAGPTLFELGKITPDERRLIWRAAMTFDCGIDHEAEAIKRGQREARQRLLRKQKPSIENPWDWFDIYGTWDEILLPLGWSKAGERAYTRPGKRFGVSATICDTTDVELLKIWSTSVQGSDHKSLGKFNALVELKFSGDRKEAIRFVRDIMKRGAA